MDTLTPSAALPGTGHKSSLTAGAALRFGITGRRRLRPRHTALHDQLMLRACFLALQTQALASSSCTSAQRLRGASGHHRRLLSSSTAPCWPRYQHSHSGGHGSAWPRRADAWAVSHACALVPGSQHRDRRKEPGLLLRASQRPHTLLVRCVLLMPGLSAMPAPSCLACSTATGGKSLDCCCERHGRRPCLPGATCSQLGTLYCICHLPSSPGC